MLPTNLENSLLNPRHEFEFLLANMKQYFGVHSGEFFALLERELEGYLPTIDPANTKAREIAEAYIVICRHKGSDYDTRPGRTPYDSDWLIKTERPDIKNWLMDYLRSQVPYELPKVEGGVERDSLKGAALEALKCI